MESIVALAVVLECYLFARRYIKQSGIQLRNVNGQLFS